MFKKALKLIVPVVIGNIIGLIIIALIGGTEVAINGIIPAFCGILAGFIFALFCIKLFDSKK